MFTSFPKELESAYQSDLANQKRQSAREGALLATLLYCGFAILDFWAIPGALVPVLAVRFLLVVPMLLGILWATYRPFFIHHYGRLMTVMYVGMGLGIETMVLLASPSDLAHIVYYAGLILVVSALYTWTFLGPRTTGLIGLSLVSIYLLIEFFTLAGNSAKNPVVVLSNGFFFVSANVIGLLAVRIRERNLRALFLAKQALQEEVTERKRMEDQVRQMAFHDLLTQLPNRRLLTDRLQQAMATSKRTERFGAVMFLDLDNFKPLNDAHGHAVGDLLLIEVARRLKSCVRELDTVARFGGDEFVLILSDLHADKSVSVTQAQAIADKVRASLSQPYELSIQQGSAKPRQLTHQCTTSIGVVLFHGHTATEDEILKRSDAAMYQSKQAGRNQVCVYATNQSQARGHA